MATITAAVVESEGADFALEEVDLDEPRSDEVVVKIEAAGICHTDLTVREGRLPTPLPAVLGHEGAGVVERVGDGVRGLSEGDRVSLSFDYCGSCPNCQAGNLSTATGSDRPTSGHRVPMEPLRSHAKGNRCTRTSSVSRRSQAARSFRATASPRSQATFRSRSWRRSAVGSRP